MVTNRTRPDASATCSPLRARRRRSWRKTRPWSATGGGGGGRSRVVLMGHPAGRSTSCSDIHYHSQYAPVHGCQTPPKDFFGSGERRGVGPTCLREDTREGTSVFRLDARQENYDPATASS